MRSPRAVDITATAIETEVLAPAATRHGPPGLTLPGQLDRITEAPFENSPAREIEDFTLGRRHVTATIRYALKDARITPTQLSSSGVVRHYVPKIHLAGQSDTRGPKLEYEEAALRSSFVGVHFFGHWLGDDAATQLLAEEYGPVLAMRTPLWPDKEDYRVALGRHYEETGDARVAKLHIFDDISQTDHKIERALRIRKQLASQRSHAPDGAIVFIARGASASKRSLTNEADLIAALASRGVRIIRAESASVREMIEGLLGARMIISVEGSQFSHGIFTIADRAGFLVLQPPDRFFNAYMDWAHGFGMQYAVVVGHQAPGGFMVSEDDLLRTIDLLDAAIG